MRRHLVRAAVAALALAAAACGGSADKAGGKRSTQPLVLTLEQSDPNYGGAQFAAAVAERSGGSIRIDVSPEWHRERVDFERGIVEDVRARRSDLGVVGVRALDTMGVTSFRGLIAPFLVDSLELEQRVLESPLVARMLAGVEQAGVVGVAALPGPLRRPFGYRRDLVGREDYEGARIGVYPGRVEAATFRSLGATTREYLNLGGASREGAALNFWGIAPDLRGRTLVVNVVFWPRAEAVVMNREAFEALEPAQQEILVDAGRQAVRRRLAAIERLENEALRTICERRLASLVTASPAQIAALHAAVRPVYAELERDGQTRHVIAQIRKLRNGEAAGEAETVHCPGAPATTGASKLEGVWEASVTQAALRAAGASRAEAATYRGPATLELKAGRWAFRGDHTTVTGAYVVRGELIRLIMATCTANPCSPGAATEYVWSVYRDTLSLRRRPGGAVWPRFVAKPIRRIR